MFSIDLACAQRLDATDPLRHIRAEFRIPQTAAGTDEIYLVGNSLGRFLVLLSTWCTTS